MSESIQRPAGFVHSLERGLAVIRCFSAERPRLTLSEAARQTGLSCHRTAFADHAADAGIRRQR